MAGEEGVGVRLRDRWKTGSGAGSGTPKVTEKVGCLGGRKSAPCEIEKTHESAVRVEVYLQHSVLEHSALRENSFQLMQTFQKECGYIYACKWGRENAVDW